MRAAFPESTHVALLYARSTTRRSNQSAMEFGWSTWVASHPALPRCPQELVITSEESASHLLSRFQCSGFAPHLRNKSLVLQRFQINVNIRQRTLDCCPCQGRRCCQI